MRSLIFSAILLLFITACSKENQNNKRIDGDWNLVKLSVFDYNGMKTEPIGEGSVHFEMEGKKTSKGNYKINFTYDYNGVLSAFVDHGTYTIENKNNVVLSSEVDFLAIPAVIAFTTKDDLILEIPNKDFFGYHLVLKKQK